MKEPEKPQDPENPEKSENPENSENSENSEDSESSKNPENSENSESSESSENPEAPSQETLIAEAELRGYLRGRNEAIERLMREPSTLERPSDPAPGLPADPDSSPMILSTPRVSIWDR